MSDAAVALVLLCAVVLVATGAGLVAGARRQVNLEEWAVAGRGLGLILVWILIAGETFTTFSVLGISGWVYAKGGPTLYVLAYLALGYVFVFIFGPAIWEAGKRHGLQTLADFFSVRYRSRAAAGLVAAAGVLFLVVYLQLQLTGLGIIVEVASFGVVSRSEATVIATLAIAGFVSLSGMRGAVWTSIFKDLMLVAGAFVVGIGIPASHFGGVGAMFHALAASRPGFLAMPGGTPNLGHSWYVSSVLVSSMLIGWPHFFAGIFTAKSADTVRRNAILMPLYVIPLVLIILAGCTAVLVVPGLANGDLALLTVVRRTFPPWALGLLGGAGALTAMVPASIHILTASTLVAKNLYKPFVDPTLSDEALARIARSVVVVMTALALYLALHSSATLVGLLLLAYSGVAQFVPGIFLGLAWKRVTLAGVVTGMVAGLAIAGVLSFMRLDPFMGLNAGFIGLCANVALVWIVSLATRPGVNGFEG
jgi:solute:Na+ symporter, SSS family